MPDQLQLRGGTTTEHNSFTGALREVTVDTTKKTLVVHDGASAGGTALMKESGGNAASSVQIGSGGVNAFTIDSNQDITLTGASANVVWDKSDNALEFADNAKALFGTGSDLEIFHDGNNSVIRNNTGGTYIKGLAGGGNTIYLQPLNNANSAVFNPTAAAELYYDNGKKLETTSDGTLTSGAIKTNAATSNAASANQATFDFNGQNARLLSYHGSGSSLSAFTNPNGGSLAERFRIDANGHVLIPADNAKLQIGASQDLEIYHDGTHSHINNATNDLTIECTTNDAAVNIKANHIHLKDETNQSFLKGIENTAAVELYFGGSKKFETTSSGVLIANGNVSSVPAGNGTASGASLDTTGGDIFTGRVFIQGENKSADSDFLTGINNNGSQLVFYDYSNTEHLLKFNKNGSTELNYDGSKKLETRSGGVTVQGQLSVANTASGGVSLSIPDNSKAAFGTGDDLQIYHSSNTNIIDSGSANFTLVHGEDSMIQALHDAQVELFHNGNKKFETTTNGVTVTGTVTETSDIALKSDIQPLTNTLEKIQQITGYKYNLINSISPSMGVIAQDVEKVFPELVHGSEGKKTLQYSGLIGVLVEAVKDLSAKVAALEAA